MADRPLRADARRNRERVLAAARDAFAESGPGVPLDEIAMRAGVGPGTVYRHFPTKEALFEAIALVRLEELTGLARAGAQSSDPAAAFDAFLARIAEEALAKRDLPEILAGGPGMTEAIAQMHEALGVLLERAREAGVVRADIDVPDLVALMKGLLQVVRDSDDPGLRFRVLAVLRDGLRPPR